MGRNMTEYMGNAGIRINTWNGPDHGGIRRYTQEYLEWIGVWSKTKEYAGNAGTHRNCWNGVEYGVVCRNTEKRRYTQ